jgi:hypothetical protein
LDGQLINGNSNLQLSSSRAVIMGVGTVIGKNETTGAPVVDTQMTVTSAKGCYQSKNYNHGIKYGMSALKARLSWGGGWAAGLSQSPGRDPIRLGQVRSSDCEKVSATANPPVGFFTSPYAETYINSSRSAPDSDLGQSGSQTENYIAAIICDSNAADSMSMGVRVDASCDPDYDSINFQHLLLNAPYVNGRYSGGFSGMVIADNVWWALGKFNFAKDNIFSQVPLLPLVDFNKILSVENNQTQNSGNQ